MSRKLDIIESEALSYPGDKAIFDDTRDDMVILQHIARTALKPAVLKLSGGSEVDWSPFYLARTKQRTAATKRELLEVLKSVSGKKD